MKITLPGDPLRAESTVLRPWRDSDAPAITAACQDPAIARWTRVPERYTDADARAFLLFRHDSLLAGTTAPFAIVSAADRLLGSVALIHIEWEPLRCEVGYWLTAEGRGQGHATRAVRLICAWGFTQLGLERIALHAATENLASQRVAQRAGFTAEATLRAWYRGKLGQEDMVSFSLLTGDRGAAGDRAASGAPPPPRVPLPPPG